MRITELVGVLCKQCGQSCINLLFLVFDVAIFQVELEPGLLRERPNAIVRWWPGTEKCCALYRSLVLTAQKFVKLAEADGIAMVEDAVVHRFVDVVGEALYYCTSPPPLNVEIRVVYINVIGHEKFLRSE